MAMIAYKCPDIEVVVVDINAARIAAWNSDVRVYRRSCHLTKTTNIPEVYFTHWQTSNQSIRMPLA
jgi:hypothetical protein